jgi:tetratricopeptide (TPR) repeat protein
MEEFEKALQDFSAAIDRASSYGLLGARSWVYWMMDQWELSLRDAEAMLEVAQTDKERANAYVRIGSALRGAGMLADALRALEEAVALDPENYGAYFEAGMVYRTQNQRQSAVAAFDRGLAIEPNEAFGLTFRGVSYSELGMVEKAEKDLEESLAQDEFGVHKALNHAFLADSARQQKDYERAIHHATLALDHIPRRAHAMAYVVRGASHRARGEYEATVRDCSEAIDRNSQYPFAHAERGAAYRALGKYDLTIADCSQALALWPFFSFARFERAQAELAKYRGVGRELAGSAAELPAILMDTQFLPRFNPEVGRSEQAPRFPAEADRPAVANSRPYTPEPVIREESQDDQLHPLQRAANDFEMLWNLEFEPAASASGLAQCLHAMGHFSEAAAVCEQALEGDRGTSELHLARTWTAYALGEIERGFEHARLAVEAGGDPPQAKLALACGYALMEKWKECQQECHEALGQNPSSAVAARLLLLWYVAETQQGPSERTHSVVAEWMEQAGISTRQWPGPLLQALVDDEPLEDLAARLPDEDEEHIRRHRLCQALYYFGMRDLGAGRLVEARDKLRRALQVGMRQHVEYSLADVSLGRLRI